MNLETDSSFHSVIKNEVYKRPTEAVWLPEAVDYVVAPKNCEENFVYFHIYSKIVPTLVLNFRDVMIRQTLEMKIRNRKYLQFSVSLISEFRF